MSGQRCLSGLLAAVGLGSCSGETASPPSAGAVFADVIDPVVGIADRENDPAVVGVLRDGVVVCAGALIAPDVVLTSGGCAAPSLAVCSAAEIPTTTPAASLFVRVGDDAFGNQLLAGVREVKTPPGGDPCAAPIALLLLQTPIDPVGPLAVRATGAAQGDRVRSVGFARAPSGFVVRTVRDHVAVVAANPAALTLREEPCQVGCGGPVVDEPSAQVVAVLSRPYATVDADAGADVAERTDVFLPFIDGVLGQSASGRVTGAPLKTKKGPVDFGAVCAGAIDCAASVCVAQGVKRYCSRTCSAHDHCPPHSRCEASVEGVRVCVER